MPMPSMRQSMNSCPDERLQAAASRRWASTVDGRNVVNHSSWSKPFRLAGEMASSRHVPRAASDFTMTWA